MYELLAELSVLTFIGVLVSYLLVDAMYARYTIEIVNENATRAATIGALMHVLLAYGVLSYTQNALYIIAIVIGSWIGTYYVVRKAKQESKQKTQEA